MEEQDFGSAQAQQYMSPYLQNVLNVQKQAAIDILCNNKLLEILRIQAGAFGGSRSAVEQALAGQDCKTD